MEITNKSLLAINASLEAAKHKQAKEIRDLRRRLRETRLSLPPRVYKELRSSGAAEEFECMSDGDDEIEEVQQPGKRKLGEKVKAIAGSESSRWLRHFKLSPHELGCVLSIITFGLH